MQKTRKLGNLLTEMARERNFESKMLEQKIFKLWPEQLGAPLGTKTIPISLSDGILQIYTEYPPYKNVLLFRKLSIIADLNAELEEPILTDIRIDIRPGRAVTPRAAETKPPEPQPKPPKQSNTDLRRRTTPEELEQIEQTLANVTDARLKKSLRRLFTTQSEK